MNSLFFFCDVAYKGLFCIFMLDNMKRHFYILFCLLFAVNGALFSQDQPLRIEFESDPGIEPYVGIPCGIYGVLTLYPTLDEKENVVDWKFVLLDVNFKPVWTKAWEIGKELKFRHEDREDNILYIAFSKSGKTKDEVNMQVLRIDLTTSDFFDQKVTIEGRPQSSSMAISKNNVLLGVERSKGNANLICLDFNTGEKPSIPFELNEDHRLLSIDFDNQINQYCIITSFEPSKYTESLDCYFWEPRGSTFEQTTVTGFVPRHAVNNAAFFSRGDTLSMIIGGYNDVSYAQRNYADDYGTPFSGLFSYNIITDSLKIYPISEFENVYNLIQASDIKTTRKHKEKDKDLEVKLYLAFHEPEIHANEIILFTESYYPQFHTVSTMAYDYYGRPLTTYYDVFDGFRYNKAIVTGFDFSGNIIWSNHMDIRDVIVDRNKNICTLVKDNDYYMLAYAGIGNVASQVIDKEELIDDITVAGVDFLYKRDRLMDTGTSTIEHWYGSYFLVSGYQTIRNSRVTSSGKRTVFYMNKMAYK